MKAYHLCSGVLLLIGLATLGRPAAAQNQPTTGPSPGLIDLNRAIKAYLDEERDRAAEVFEGLLKADPQVEYRATCYYYLGLISLENGLRHSTEAQNATAQQQAELAAQKANEARADFEKAQGWFQQVVSLADPSAELVSAAVLLGIAQLASDYPGLGKDTAFQLSRRAEDTLRRYVTQTEPGKRDRYGYFYLAVAQYRLADDYSARGMGAEFAESIRSAQANVERARALAQEEREAGRLSPAEVEDFRTVLTYYDALLAILQRQNARARTLFTEVSERAAGTDLARNAQAIIKKLEAVETAGPLPISLPVPKPLGPWDFDARLRLGNGYDSNVILLGKDTILPRGYRRKDDYRVGLSGDFNLSRYIPKSEWPAVGESLSVGIGGGTQNLWGPNIPQFDINRYPARAYVNWQPIHDLYLGFQYEYSYTLLGTEPYISSHRITPVISKTWRKGGRNEIENELGRTDLYWMHDERNYLDRSADFRLNRDGVYDAIGLQQRLNLVLARNLPYLEGYFATHEREARLFGNDWLSCYAGYEYRSERTVGTEFDLTGNSLIWGVNVPLPYRLAFELNGEFTWDGYLNPSVFDFTRRERFDFLQRYDFGLTYTFVKKGECASLRTLEVKLRTGIEAMFNNSNIQDRLSEKIYEYDRAIYGVQLEVDF